VTLPDSKKTMKFVNTNGLVRASDWQIGLQKTGYISEAGKCLVMQAMIANQPVVIVLLDSGPPDTGSAMANLDPQVVEKESHNARQRLKTFHPGAASASDDPGIHSGAPIRGAPFSFGAPVWGIPPAPRGNPPSDQSPDRSVHGWLGHRFCPSQRSNAFGAARSSSKLSREGTP
jgi:hypothetical protein